MGKQAFWLLVGSKLVKFHHKDGLYHKAKKDGLAARSYYKLEAIDKKHRLVKKHQRVLDVGAAPGSWVQYIQEKSHQTARIKAFDLNPLKLPGDSKNVEMIQADVLDAAFMNLHLKDERFDLILSDLAPQTSGIKLADHERSCELCRAVLEMARNHAKAGSAMVMKNYQGEDTPKLLETMKTLYRSAALFKPPSSRKQSWEVFLVGLGRILKN